MQIFDMNRPPRPRFMNNTYRSPRPYHHQWRPNHTPPARFPWGGNPHFGALDMRTENSEEHWCETCDRGFPTADLLHKHKQQHQKCNIDGCQFVAHPKVITKHIQMQHSSGLYKKIANLNNPEEIQKWREERKKKYPTKLNIEKKAAECKEKIERGEKMALKHNYRNDKSTDQGPGIKRKHSFDKRNQNQRSNRQNFKSDSTIPTDNNKPPAKKIAKTIPCAPSTTEKNKLLPFTGILNIDMDEKAEDNVETIDCNNDLFEDDDYEASTESPKETPNSQQPVLCGALTSLMCDYGTSDEEPEEKENVVVNNITPSSIQNPVEPIINETNKIETPLVNRPEIIENKSNESDDDGPEEVKIVKTNIEQEAAQETVTKTIKQKEKPLPAKKVYPPKHDYNIKRKIPSTLLQKLLHTEIRQERNIVLQCIRYIKKNNYFDKL